MDNQVYKDMESKLKNKFKYQMWVLYLIEALLFALCTFVFKVTFISTYELVCLFVILPMVIYSARYKMAFGCDDSELLGTVITTICYSGMFIVINGFSLLTLIFESVLLIQFVTTVYSYRKGLSKKEDKAVVKKFHKDDIKKIVKKLVVPLFIFVIIFFVLLDDDDNSVPRDENIYSMSLNYEVYNDEAYYLDNESYANSPNKLLVNDIDKNKITETVIENVDEFKLGGKYIFAQCNENRLEIFDVESKEKVRSMTFSQPAFRGVNLENFAGLKLMCADSEGAYIVADDGLAIGIYKVTVDGYLNDIIVFPNMTGDIERMIVSENYLIFGYSGDELNRGTYVYDFKANSVEKVSSVVGEDESLLFPAFIWNDAYLVAEDYDLCMISLATDEEKRINIPAAHSNLWIDGNWLYAGSHTGLEKYNLNTGEIKIYKDYECCVGTMKIYGDKMYLGYIMKNDDGTHTPKVIAKPLKSFMWEEYSGNLFGE